MSKSYQTIFRGVMTAEDYAAWLREREEHRQRTHLLTFARRHGLSAGAAERFLARAAASLKRQRLTEQVRATLSGLSTLLCPCGMELAITRLPFRCPQCHREWLKETA